ncbi:MAG: DUF1559 domain-containing protein [Pirellulaceae bacterium]|nr:DUF1559 domain-containing protein [Pirellulaceae bacterium]MDP7018547.1 DUF1559 domain-containing protein [Pirellulaceae bacterium]
MIRQGGGGSGIFYHNSNLGFVDVRDGSSQTVFVGERNSKLGYSTWVGVVHGVKYAIPRIVGSTARTPNRPDAQFEDFSSHHPGTTQFLFGDGAVRPIADEIDGRAYHALGTRQGNEVIGGGVFQ